MVHDNFEVRGNDDIYEHMFSPKSYVLKHEKLTIIDNRKHMQVNNTRI